MAQGETDEEPLPSAGIGGLAPDMKVRPPGAASRTWLLRHTRAAAPMGPRWTSQGSYIDANVPPGAIVLSVGHGSNVEDVDGNRYVDLAAGFGSLLLGHTPTIIHRALECQSQRLWQGLGDVYPSDAKVGLVTRLAELTGDKRQVILGQTGADAVSGALKTAVLYTGRPGVVGFSGAYHGLSNGPLAVSNLRDSYKKPFAEQLNPHVSVAGYPRDGAEAERSLQEVERILGGGRHGAILVEPILGRGGIFVPPGNFLPSLAQLAKQHGALLIADEVWTGLGRAGRLLFSQTDEFSPDIICLGKGLGGGLPISAILGKTEIMAAWSRDEEVVETSTFAGAPLASSCALALLGALERQGLAARSAEVGARFMALLSDVTGGEVRGAGLMLGLPCESIKGGAVALQRALLERGYLTTTGGGDRDVLILTPALNIEESLLQGFCEALEFSLRGLRRPR